MQAIFAAEEKTNNLELNPMGVYLRFIRVMRISSYHK